MIRDQLELVLSYLQFLALLLTIPNIDFPDVSVDVGNILDFLATFDFWDFLPIPTDFKIQFILTVIALPLMVSVIMLIGLNSKTVILWYFATLFFLMCGVVGGLLLIFDNFGWLNNPDTHGSKTLAYVGGVGLALCLVAAAIRYRLRGGSAARDTKDVTVGNQDEEEIERRVELHKSMMTKQEMMEAACKSIRPLSIASLAVQAIIMAVLGCFLLGYFSFGEYSRDRALGTSTLQTLGVSLGVILLICAGLGIVWLIMSLFYKGRIAQFKIREVWALNLMLIGILFLSLLYIPIVAKIVMVYNCNKFTCPPGFRLPDITSAVFFNSTHPVCEPCFNSTQCPRINGTCPGLVEWRLEHARQIECSEMYVFYYPAAAFMLACFAIGLPVLFHRLTNVSASTLAKNFPVLPLVKGEYTPDELWAEKVRLSDNITKFLYQSFEFRWKQWRLIMILHKLVIVAATVYVVRTDNFQLTELPICAALAVHVVFLVWVAYHKPFIHLVEDRLATVMQLCLFLTAVIGLILFFGWSDVPGEVVYTILIANIVLPIVVFVVYIIMTSRGEKQDEAEQLREKKKAELEEQIRREEEEAAAAAAAAAAATADAEGRSAEGEEAEEQTKDAQVESEKELVSYELHVSKSGSSQAPPVPPSPPPQPGDVLSRYIYNAYANMPGAVTAEPQPTHPENHTAAPAFVMKGPTVDEEATAELVRKRQEMRKKYAVIQNECDQDINEASLAIVRRYFMMTGAVCFLALGLCLMGLLGNKGNPYRFTSATTHTLGEYQTWDEFTSACCCMPYTNPNSTDHLSVLRRAVTTELAVSVEKWICPNGDIKERVRETLDVKNNVSYNGFRLRPLCSPFFRACTLNATAQVESCPLSVTEKEKELW